MNKKHGSFPAPLCIHGDTDSAQAMFFIQDDSQYVKHVLQTHHVAADLAYTRHWSNISE